MRRISSLPCRTMAWAEVGEHTLTPSVAEEEFREFIRTFRENNCYIYRDQLLQHYRKERYSLKVDLNHLNGYDQVLQDVLRSSRQSFCPTLRMRRERCSHSSS